MITIRIALGSKDQDQEEKATIKIEENMSIAQ